MIDFEALFKISYGLYIVSSGDKEKGNGFISNTFFQVTSDPAKFASCCNKENYTAELIKKSGTFSASVLSTNADPAIISRFGYKSGRDIDKFDGLSIEYGATGVPIVLNDCIAYMECKVVETIDVGTHYMFIGELVQAKILDDSLEPITYSYFRKVRKGSAPKNAPTYVDKSKLEKKDPPATYGKYKCLVCGYIYDEELGDPENSIAPGTKFEDLPENWVCPVCGTEKDDFVKMD